jgi:hypothetical protein
MLFYYIAIPGMPPNRLDYFRLLIPFLQRPYRDLIETLLHTKALAACTLPACKPLPNAFVALDTG